jgi:NADH:ubiquinone oxidoreductase subunit F (NADH-binding)
VIAVLPHGACGLCETALVLDYLARESAGQCGPCTFGLRAIADGVSALTEGLAPPAMLERLRRWAGDVEGRGACHHPDGAVRLLRSTLDVFAGDAAQHARGTRCEAERRPGLLNVPVMAA